MTFEWKQGVTVRRRLLRDPVVSAQRVYLKMKSMCEPLRRKMFATICYQTGDLYVEYDAGPEMDAGHTTWTFFVKQETQVYCPSSRGEIPVQGNEVEETVVKLIVRLS